jgi:SAM-dependent methyltransferase
MGTEPERIARAYRGYAETQAGDRRWTLDNPGNRAALQERTDAVRRLLAATGWLPLGAREVLEVGCGLGGELARMQEFGAEPGHLHGIDLIPERVQMAKERHPELDVRVGNAEHLRFSDGAFDLVMAITVFSSIHSPEMAGRVAGEIERVIRPGGALLWYDIRYDNPRNRDVHAVSEAAVRRLFPNLHGRLETLTLMPPLARRLGRLTGALYPTLRALPPLRTHLLGLLVR